LKIRKTNIVAVLLGLLIGLELGVILQKYWGVENLFNDIDVHRQKNSPPQKIGLSETVIPKEYQGKLKLFILAGQSNMSGRGDAPKLVVKPNPKIYVFGNDYRWRLAKEPIDDPSNQVDQTSEDLDAGFSPALSFATTILERHPDMIIGLIPCAKGETSIYDWQRNLSNDTLYGSCLKRVRTASIMGNVAGLLFFQGEADARDPIKYPKATMVPNQWAFGFITFVYSLRSDLNLPELPVVYAEIGTNTTPEEFKNWKIVQEQQRSIRLPFCSMITTDDLPLKNDIHFTTDSYRVIGKRFAEAYLGLLQPLP
jgi:hypothetical protein